MEATKALGWQSFWIFGALVVRINTYAHTAHFCFAPLYRLLDLASEEARERETERESQRKEEEQRQQQLAEERRLLISRATELLQGLFPSSSSHLYRVGHKSGSAKLSLGFLVFLDVLHWLPDLSHATLTLPDVLNGNQLTIHQHPFPNRCSEC